MVRRRFLTDDNVLTSTKNWPLKCGSFSPIAPYELPFLDPTQNPLDTESVILKMLRKEFATNDARVLS